jgi:arginine utilization protein RocB
VVAALFMRRNGGNMNGNREIVKEKIEPKEQVLKGMDLRIAELNTEIVAAINKANLPAKVLEYTFAEYLNLMRSKAQVAVAEQQKAYEEEVKKNEEIHKS